MKKYLILFLLFFSALTYSQNYIKDTIYGNVKSVREKMILLDSVPETIDPDFPDFSEYSCDACFTDRESLLWRINYYWYNSPCVAYGNYLREYNDKKQITKETWFYKNGNMYKDYMFAYNNNEKLIEEKETNYKGNISKIRRWGYDYKNRLASKLKVNDSDIGYVFENFEYDNDGNLIEEAYFTDEEKRTLKSHEYINNKRIKTYFKSPHSYICNEETGRFENIRQPDINLAYEYEYDLKDKLIKETCFIGLINGESTESYIIRFVYDSNNNLLARYENGNYSRVRKYQYNKKNQLIKEEHFSKGILTYKNEYFYKNGNLIKLIEEEDKNKEISEFEYKFDSQNNWIEQVKIINGKRLHIRKRNIVYY